MQINWSEIKKYIFSYSKKVFIESNISYSDTEIEEAICIFKNFINIHCSYAFLNGLNKELFPALQIACILKVGDLISLKNLLSNLEAFLKKMLVLTGVATYADISNHRNNLMWLYKKSGISQKLINSNPTIDETTLSSFIGDSECLYAFSLSYLSRNQLHNSPDWDPSEVTYRLKYCLALYIFIIINYRNRLLSFNPELNKNNYIDLFNDDESKLLYNYFSFGRTSIIAKNELIESFILHLLHKNGPMAKGAIERELNIFTQNSILSSSFIRLIDTLASKEFITIDRTADLLHLTANQKERLKDQEENYNDNARLFNDALDEVLISHSLMTRKNEIISELRKFFEENYNIDINEGCEIDNSTTSVKIFQGLFSYLKTICSDENVAEQIFKEIIEICKTNDFLVRLSAGKVFSKISNPDQFSNYISNSERIIYLDTQIVLYCLCINTDYPKYDDVYYRIAKNLVEMSRNRNDIKLFLSDHYLGEITTHLKQALLLIPFTEIEDFKKYKISNNIFYSYYYQLKERDSLPQSIESFADFMEDLFQLREEDALESSFFYIASGILNEILPTLNIEIEEIPHYNDDEVAVSRKVFEKVISINMLENKNDKVLSNDSIMGCHLFNKQFHNDKEPFFLTYDKAFTPFRKMYIELYRRNKASLLHWYLFTPGKFLNHLDLIAIKINVNSLTDDLLSIMDNNKFKEKTKTIVDTISKLIDIKNISKENRRDYIEISKRIFTNEEFPCTVDKVDQSDSKTKKFTTIVDVILNYYRDMGEAYINNFKNMLRNKDYFTKMVESIKVLCLTSDLSNEQIISQIDNLFKLYNKEVLES